MMTAQIQGISICGHIFWQTKREKRKERSNDKPSFFVPRIFLCTAKPRAHSFGVLPFSHSFFFSISLRAIIINHKNAIKCLSMMCLSEEFCLVYSFLSGRFVGAYSSSSNPFLFDLKYFRWFFPFICDRKPKNNRKTSPFFGLCGHAHTFCRALFYFFFSHLN